MLHKLDFALIYTFAAFAIKKKPEESATQKRFRSQQQRVACPSTLATTLFLCCKGIYIAEMTVKNVKGQKRVCKFK